MQEFMGQCLAYFDGSHDAFGTFEPSPGTIDGVKVQGKATVETRAVTSADWVEHLEGRKALGIAPLNSQGLLRFAVINVDAYDNQHQAIIDKIIELKLPLAPVRSKSGGLHLYLFLSGLVPAAPVVARMKDMAAALGLGQHSIIPSQTEVIADRGDMGRWVMMPYYGYLKQQTATFAYRNDGVAMDLRSFLLSAESLFISADKLAALIVPVPEMLFGAPPCLQYLTEAVEAGGKVPNPSKLVYNYAIYAKKAEEPEWKEMVKTFNGKIKQSLPEEALAKTIEIVAKQDRRYTCNELPIKQYCNKAKCHRCQYGVKIASGMPSFGTLTKVEADEVTWFVALEGGKRIELSTEQLQSAKLFQARCMEATSLMPAIPKREEWEAVVQELMADVMVVKLPEDVSVRGILVAYLENFLTARPLTTDEAIIASGRPYVYNSTFVCFRMQDFLAYLDAKNFRQMKSAKIGLVIRERFGAQNMTTRVGGRTYFVWMVPIDRLPLLPVPTAPEKELPESMFDVPQMTPALEKKAMDVL